MYFDGFNILKPAVQMVHRSLSMAMALLSFRAMFVRVPGKAHQLGQRLGITRMPGIAPGRPLGSLGDLGDLGNLGNLEGKPKLLPQEVVSAEGSPFLLVLCASFRGRSDGIHDKS